MHTRRITLISCERLLWRTRAIELKRDEVETPNHAFFRGHIVPYGEAKVGVLTHALNYGPGVFGGLRGYWNDEEEQLFIFRPEDHYRRFLKSVTLLCMDLPYAIDDLVEATRELLRKEDFRQDCYIRPLGFLSDEIIGVRLQDLNAELSMRCDFFRVICRKR